MELEEAEMERVARRMLWRLGAAVALLGAASAASAESEQYCTDYQGAVAAQIKRGDAARCSLQGWFWSRDPREHFDFCRANDLQAIQYWQMQRESQLRYCEYQTSTDRRETVGDIRVSGGPGDYTIHWTIHRVSCEGGGLGETCSVQIRLEPPPGRPGGFAVELSGQNGNKAFTTTRADRYPGQPGDVVVLKWHSCSKPGIGSSHCRPWNDVPLVMPAGAPEFRAARVVSIDPAEYVPDRFRRDRLVAQKAGPQNFYRFHVRLDGTKDAFAPAPFQGGESWKPEVRVRVLHGQKLLKDSGIMGFPANGLAPVEVPVAALNDLPCQRNVGVTGLCTTIDVEVESYRRWTSGNIRNPQEAMGKSRGQLRVTNPVAALGGQAQARVPIYSARLEALSFPPQITSQCNAAYHIGTVPFTAQLTKVDIHTDSRPIPVELQFSGGQGLWGTSPLLQGLQVVHDSKPPQFRAALSVAQLTRTASAWRWRVKARVGESWSNWCQFTVAEPQSTGMVRAPATVQPKPPAALTGGQNTGQAIPGTLGAKSPTTTAPMAPGAPRQPSGTSSTGSRALNAPINAPTR